MIRDNTRPACYSLPSERIALLFWAKSQGGDWPTLWQRIVRAIGRR